MKRVPQWRLRRPVDDAATVYVSEKFGVRSLHIGSDTVQSSMRLARPFDLELSYTRSMMAWPLFRDDPQDVLMIGLGGGSLAKFLHRYVPAARTRVIEISPHVVHIARQLFQVPPDDERLSIIVGDAARYLEDTPAPADLLVIDGYDAEAQVEALATRAFYENCSASLRSGGLAVVNLWGGDKAFTTILERMEAVFTGGTLCLPAEKPGNVIAFGFKDAAGPWQWSDLDAAAERLESRFNLEFPKFVSGLRKMNRHDETCLYAT